MCIMCQSKYHFGDHSQAAKDDFNICVLGDVGVGKSRFSISYVTTHCLSDDDHIPNETFAYYSRNIKSNGNTFIHELYELPSEKRTTSSESDDQAATWRNLHYKTHATTIYFICYAVDDRGSFESIKSKWYPEIRKMFETTPMLLVATKTDMRKSWTGMPYVTYEEGSRLATELHCGFVETSALTMSGLNYCQEKVMESINILKVRKLNRIHGGKLVKLPPMMPAVELAPSIEIQPSSLGADLAAAYDNPVGTDVKFYFEDGKTLSAHRVFLCCASDFFCHIFEQKLPQALEDELGEGRVPAFTWEDINSGGISGLSSIKQAAEEDQHQIDICLSADISYKTFESVLRFLYGGVSNVKDVAQSELDAVLEAADIFHLPSLQDISTDEISGIGVSISDGRIQRLKEMFLNKQTFSDVQFEVEGQLVYAHKCILAARCSVMGKMFSGNFAESTTTTQIPILETSLVCFQAVLEYLYTDHAPIEEGDAVGILVTAERFAQDRLKNLCELYITKEVDVSVRDCIEKADIDVIGLLQTSQFHNARQLSDWCLHFISSHYLEYEKRGGFHRLEGSNLNYVTKNRWPPTLYLEQIEEWEAKYGKKKRKEKCSVM